MGTQPELCGFDYQSYEQKVRPAFQSILRGDWPDWILEKYGQDAYFPQRGRICNADKGLVCTCFNEDLCLQNELPCIDRREWADSRLLRFFDKALLDHCIPDHRWLPKNLLDLDSLWQEAFAVLGLDDKAFQDLLNKLCNRWKRSWIDVDNAGPCGYLTAKESAQFLDRLGIALSNNTNGTLNDDEEFTEFRIDLAELESLGRNLSAGGYGLLWNHDLLSEYWK